MAEERRRHRSEVPEVALRLYLNAMASRSGLPAVALASDEGLLVAASPGDYDAEGLAAICVARELKIPLTRASLDGVLKGERFSSAPMEVHGLKLHLAWLGDKSPRLVEVAAALNRILGPTRRTAAARPS